MPFIRAAELAECGLSCLAMIGSFYGHDIDLLSLRQRFSISLNGLTLRGLISVAERMDLSTRALRVDLQHLHKLKLPAILHWDFQHFVVVAKVSRTGATIYDPSSGIQHLPFSEVSKHFTGVVLEVTPATKFEAISARQSIRLNSLWSQSSGLGGAVAQVLLLTAALQLATFAAPFQTQLVVDEAIGRSDGALLTILVLGFAALAILQAGIDALRGWVLQAFGMLFTFQVLGNLVHHLLRLRVDYFEKRTVGDILSRFGSTTSVQDAVTKGLVSALLDGVMALVAVIILFVYSSALATIVVAGVVLNGIVAFAIYPASRARMEEQMALSSRERTHLLESIRAATTIKIMGQEGSRESAWKNLYARYLNALVAQGNLTNVEGFLQSIVTTISTAAVIYFGAKSIIDGSGFSIGMLLAFFSFRQTFTERMTSLTNQAVQFRLLKLHLERMSDIVLSDTDVPKSLGAEIARRGAIKISNVSFRYSSVDRIILDRVNLEIEPGDFVSISGPSGGGKTTLLKLLLGLYDPTEGTISLDGQRASPALWRAWREGVGVVAQDDRLLSGTIADNISFFDPAVDMDRVHAAAQDARIYDDIARMPMQFSSLIGDMGSSLSGGQRQRVLLARALYRNPEVLILDEGTANLDEKTEGEIAQLVASLPITRIVVAHRPALLKLSDRHFVVDRGEIFPA